MRKKKIVKILIAILLLAVLILLINIGIHRLELYIEEIIVY